MAGSGFRVDYSRLFARIHEAEESLRPSGEVMQELAEFGAYRVFSDSQQSFVRQADPTTGKSWKPSFRARVKGGQTLLDSRRLSQSVITEGRASGKKVTVTGGTVPLVYAAIHQFGGDIRPVRAKWLRFRLATGEGVRTKHVRIPARPYVGLGPRSIELIAAKFRQLFRGRAQGK